MSLKPSLENFLSNVKKNTEFNYLSNRNSVKFLQYDSEQGILLVARGEETLRISIIPFNNLLIELEKGVPIHVDTFLHSGDNNRSIIETILANLPEIVWTKLDNKKHIQAFTHEMHREGKTFKYPNKDWSSPEWALGVLIYTRLVERNNLSTIASYTSKKLSDITNRNEKSWQARIFNFRSLKTGGGFDGGESGREMSEYWIDRSKTDIQKVEELAAYAFSDTSNPDDIKLICNQLTIKPPVLIGNKVTPPEMMNTTLHRSLITKPFTILTGASGTGKTRLAKDITKYLSNAEGTNSATVAVGADWTDNRSVLGFVNHLRTVEKGGVKIPIYQSTPILDLMLAATAGITTPYFLILDEMNLSHVERYFADFLSAMEQDDGVLELHKEGEQILPRYAGDEQGVPHQINYPQNLFVIGTVNIDETTYMFSPKVLDRANVIEFTVAKDTIESFLKAPTTYPEIETATPGIAEGFLTLAKQARNLDVAELPKATTDRIASHLLDLFVILKDGRFEFAFRTAKEINAYLRVCRHLSTDQGTWDSEGWKQDLDDQILQKLLPKLHGSMGRIGGLLAELADYCHTGTYTERAENAASIQLKTAGNLVATDSTPFPKSLAKLKAMIRTLQDEQFVSFIQ